MRAPIFLATVLAVACSSSSPPPCNERPSECGAGETCWVKDTTGAFACLPSASGKGRGAACEDTVGIPTCDHGFACFQQDYSSSGTCAAYCDPSAPSATCVAGETCATARFAGVAGAIHLCIAANADGG